MKAGNASYESPAALPEVIPVFPLPGAILLPRAEMPLTIFEPRYVAMVDAAIAGDRIIGMVQPEDGASEDEPAPALRTIGCAGRITSLTESGDGRYAVTLTGISRFRVVKEMPATQPFRLCRVTTVPFAKDFRTASGSRIDRTTLLTTFRAYLEANNLEADWEAVNRTSSEMLVNALSMMAPFAPAEKQALLEAPDLRSRAETLVAITEMSLARGASAGHTLQ